ncbi:MAG: alkaline phosphatase family protein, partial [Kiritimatiellae bacterium]|nr:alkaline phosphatase family protein [Kiritimatiellia bacterium]
MDLNDRWLVVVTAALGWDTLQRRAGAPRSGGGLAAADFRRAESQFPALTCPFQATLRTGLPPSGHGVWFNGLYDRRLARPLFWEQHAALAHGPRVWSARRAAGQRVAVMFWQQILGEAADIVLSPRPIHRHHGGMVPDCLDQPAGLYRELCAELGGAFPLHRYWGPMAGAASSRWIAESARALMARGEAAPDLLLVYLPHLDYDLQRHGPDSPRAIQALDETMSLLSNLWTDAAARGVRMLITGDYA